MIPELDDRGYLPPGVHRAALAEVIARFGHGSEIREAQGHSLEWLMSMCKAAGIARLVINGSFVTDSLEPNDVDCVLLQGPAYRASSQVAQELGKGLPFLELKVVEQDDFDYLTSVMFSSDRDFVPKGMVEVPLDD